MQNALRAKLPVQGTACLAGSPISQSPLSRTSPSWTTTVSPPHHRGLSVLGSTSRQPATFNDVTVFCMSPWMSPTAAQDSSQIFCWALHTKSLYDLGTTYWEMKVPLSWR